MRPFLFSVGAFLAIVMATPSPAAEQRLVGGPNRVALVELFTSEGCSSCPPAERWLGSLREEPGLWRDFVPLAFHVNYWDHLGWPDRFASREFTQRQRAHASRWGTDAVYTPCFVRNGAEWRPEPRPPAASSEKAGLLVVTLHANRRARAEFTPIVAARADAVYDLHVALLGSGLGSQVTAGENRGETLRHEFAVLALQKHRLAAGGAASAIEFDLPRSKIAEVPRQALAAWITLRGELAPLQATGGWLEPGN